MRDSLLGVLIERGGFRRGRRTATFIINWLMAREALDQKTMRVDEFAGFWEISLAQSYRMVAEMRALLGDEWTPDAVCDVLKAQRVGRVDRVKWAVA